MIRIAIDGPSGAGKSTLAKSLATALSLEYIDTGSMYRAIGYKAIRSGIKVEDDKEIENMLENTAIDFSNDSVYLDGQAVEEYIRTQEVAQTTSEIAAKKAVRDKLGEIQKAIGKTRNVVMDGRDIGTNVIPDAEIKIFITATVEERAQRRYLQLLEKGQKADLDTIKKEVEDRDYNDINRPINPLKKAEDAVEIDTTGLSAEESFEKILSYIKSRIEKLGFEA